MRIIAVFIIFLSCFSVWAMGAEWTAKGISCDSQGNVYVVDELGHVRKFSTSGEFLRGWVLPREHWVDEEPFPLLSPGTPDISIGPEDNVYVISPDPGDIMKFSPEGILLAGFPVRGAPGGRTPRAIDLRGTDLSLEIDLEVNAEGIFFLDHYFKRISHFSLGGELIARYPLEQMPDGFIVKDSGEILLLYGYEFVDLEGVSRGRLPQEEIPYYLVDGGEVYVILRPTSAPYDIVKRYRDCEELLQEWGPTFIGGPCGRDVTSDTLGNIYFITNCYPQILRFSEDRVEHWDAWGNVTFSTPCALNRPWDVNRDGRVDLIDIALVGRHYDEEITADWEWEYIPDCNFDGRVSDWDLEIVASHFGETYGSSSPRIVLDLTQKEQGKIQVFQNYPNPFNPETWIPYVLTQGAEVEIKIHSSAGGLVRILDLGFKEPGVYFSCAEAAYWDGRDMSGEEVASGVYFYTVKAGRFSQTRKMIIVK